MILRSLCLLFLAGCASTPLTEDQRYERDLKRSYLYENWDICESLYASSGVATIHMDHRHGHRDIIRMWMVASDLRINRCHEIMPTQWWAE